MGAGLLNRFPKLRIGFFEAGSQWVPYAIQQLRRRVQPVTILHKEARPALISGIDPDHYRDPEELFRSGRAFVNCEGDDDFRYVIDHIGEDALMASSDYPHGDASSEENYVTHWQERTDISAQVKEKVLGKNAARFFRL